MTIPPLSLGITKGVEWLKALNAEMFTYGQAHGYMNKNAEHTSVHALAGRLQAGPNGNLELTVPSSLIKGVFDALDEPGAEFVVRNNRTESAIKVMTKEEVDKIGGNSHISERGHSYHYTLGPIVELPASGEYDKLWAISIKSNDLEDIRKSYGLEASPQLGFYIPVGCKKNKVTEDNKVSKLAGLLKSSELVNANYNTTSLGRGTTLHHNTIEDYWPVGVPGHDKPLWLLKSRSQGHNQGPITSYALLPKNGNELAPNLGHEVANPMAYIALSEGVPGWDESPLGEYGPASEVVGLKTEIPHRRKGLASALIGFASNFENRNLYVEPDPIGDKAVARGDVEKAYLKNGFMKLDDKDPNAPLILRNYKPTSSPTLSKLASLLKLSSNDQSIGAPNSTPPIKPISLPSHSPPSGMPAPSIPQGTDFNAMYTNFQNNNPNAPVPQRPVSPMAPSPTPMPNLAAQQANDQLSGNVPIPGVPQDPRGGKYEDMARMKHFQEAAKINDANAVDGTLAAERSKQQKDSEGSAISMVASAIPAGRMALSAAKGIAATPVISNNIPNIINTASGGTSGTTLGNTWRAANLQGLTKYKTLKYGIPAAGVASTAVPAAANAIKSTVSGGIPSPYPKWMNNIPDIKEAPFSVRTGDNATISQLGSFAMDATRNAVGHAAYKGLESFSSSNKGSSNPLTYLPSAQITKATSKAVAGKAMPFLSNYANAPDYASIARDNASKRLGIQTGGIAGEIPGAFGLPSFKLNNLAPYVSQPIKDVVNAYQIPSPIKVESNPYFLKEVANKVTPNLGTAAYDAMFPNKNNAPAPASYSRPTSYADMRNTKYPSAPTPAAEPPLRKFLGEQAKTIGTRISDNLIPPRPEGQKPATMFPQIR